MKIPAIRATIGNWTYYITTLTFQQVNDCVSKIDNELHKSDNLKEMIQRSITKNVHSIKNYILNQPEVFFNSLVLAVYNDYPEWQEIEIKYDNKESYEIGLLIFSGKNKIFPVDGQHRVEGIKEALTERPNLKDTKIAAIFIGHKNNEKGMIKTRRLFSTLNRYAKPVTKDDIIALDEDDAVAIVTRNLLENHPLFTDNKITKNKNKAIQNDDKHSFTSIINLYECNKEILKFIRLSNKEDKKRLEEYLKFRPAEEDINSFEAICRQFWDELIINFQFLTTYINDKSIDAAYNYRNNKNGGNLLFRPIGLYPFILATLEIKKNTNKEFNYIFKKFSKIDLTISKIPFKQIIWSDQLKTMRMGNNDLIKLILIYIYDKKILKKSDVEKLKNKYASAINFKGKNIQLEIKKFPIA